MTGDDQASAGDRLERRPPGALDAERGLAGQERARRRRGTRGRPATTSPVCRSHSPVRPARLISACSSPPSERTTHSATLSQRTPGPRRSNSGSLKIVATGSKRHAGAGDEIGEFLGDQFDVAALVVPGDDRGGRVAVPVEQHARLADAGDADADDPIAIVELADGGGDHGADRVGSAPGRPSRRCGRRPPTASPRRRRPARAPVRSTTTALTRVDPTSTPISTSAGHCSVLFDGFGGVRSGRLGDDGRDACRSNVSGPAAWGTTKASPR